MTDLRSEIKNVIAALVHREPLIGIFLKRTWIYESNEYPMPSWTDGLRIYVNPPIFLNFSKPERASILAHEVLHIFELHIPRSKSLGVPRAIANIAADAKVNQHLSESNMQIPRNAVTLRTVSSMTGVGESELAKMSFEEIARLLARNVCSGRQGGSGAGCDGSNCSSCTGGDGAGDLVETSRCSRGNVLNEGDAGDENAGSDEIANRAAKKAVETYTVAKTAGTVPGWAERIVGEILKPKVDWRRLLRAALERGLGKKVRRSWMRPSRKGEPFPGKELLNVSTVVVAVDTSGSIGVEELRRFISEVYGICRESARVVVIPWDSTAYDPIVISRAGDVRRIKLRGGGGTCFCPVVRALENMSYSQLVILSDWEISDLGSAEVIGYLKKNAGRIIAVTTYRTPPAFLRAVRIDRW
jgi:predicted metal-dependent peptidase